MKRMTYGIVLGALISSSSQAALLSRAAGQAYYDSVLNITLVMDANLAKTSGYDADGLMTWDGAQAWIASLNTASYLGVSNWRQPSMDVNADTTLIDCSTATEPNCRDNEMGYMYWQNLVRYPSSPSPFTNFQNSYWSGTENAPDTSLAWRFDFITSSQLPHNKTFTHYAWAVRPGDIGAVPVPGAAWLFGSALGLLGLRRRKPTAL